MKMKREKSLIAGNGVYLCIPMMSCMITLTDERMDGSRRERHARADTSARWTHVD
jgi:hypothetical protein